MFLYTILFLSIVISHFNVLAAPCTRTAPFVQNEIGTESCECGSDTCYDYHDSRSGGYHLYYQPWCDGNQCGDTVPECPYTDGQTVFYLGFTSGSLSGKLGSISKTSPGTHCKCGSSICYQWKGVNLDHCDASKNRCSVHPLCTNTDGTVEQSRLCMCDRGIWTNDYVYCVANYPNAKYLLGKYCDITGSPTCHATKQPTPCTADVVITGESCKCGSTTCEIGETCSNNACITPNCTNTTGININTVKCMCDADTCTANSYCHGDTCRDVPSCANTGGLTVNSADCQCGSNKCDTTSGLYCDVTNNQCSPYKLCNDGANATETCQCGTGAECVEGQLCSNGQCTTHDCAKTTGFDENSAMCNCGSITCTAATGLYCIASENSCGATPLCKLDKNNEKECVCQSGTTTTTCTASTGLLCQSSGPSKCDDNSGRDETACTTADTWHHGQCCHTALLASASGGNVLECANNYNADGSLCTDNCISGFDNRSEAECPDGNSQHASWFEWKSLGTWNGTPLEPCCVKDNVCTSRTNATCKIVGLGPDAGWRPARCNDERSYAGGGRSEAVCNGVAANWITDLCEPHICENRDGLIVNDVHCKCDTEKVTNGDYSSASTFCAPNEYCKEADITWDFANNRFAQRGRAAECSSTKFCEHTDGMTAASANCKCGSTTCASGQYCFDLFDPRGYGSTANLDSSICLDKPLCANTDGTVLNDGDCVCGDKTCTKTNGHICSSFEVEMENEPYQHTDKDYYFFNEPGRAQRKIVVRGTCSHPECPSVDGQSCKCGSNTCDVDNGMNCGLSKEYEIVNSDTCQNHMGTKYDCQVALQTPFQPYCLDKSNRNKVQCVLNASEWIGMCLDGSGRNQIQCALNASTWEIGSSLYEQSVNKNIYLAQGTQLNEFPPGCSVLIEPFRTTGNAQHSMYFNPNMNSPIQCGQDNRDCICLNIQGDATCSIEYCVNTDGETPNNVKCHCGGTECTAGQYCSTADYTCSDVPECEWQDGSQVTDTACKCDSTTCTVGQLCTAGSCKTPTPCSETDGTVPNDDICSCGATTAGSCVRWRQTDSVGEREYYNDKSCDAIIASGLDGYCECENGRRESPNGGTCEDACAGTTSVICDYEQGLFCNAATFKCSTQSSERYLQNIKTCHGFRTTFVESCSDPALQACSQCSPGKYFSALGNCEKCQGGKYSTYGVANATGCLSCDVGEFSEAGSSSCSTCPEGKYSNVGSYSCIDCPSGKKKSGLVGNETTACDTCEVGKFQPSKGQVSCQDCPEGTYQDSKGQPVCNICPEGTYQDSLGETICKSCSVGKYNNKEGQNNSVACVQCTPGYYTADTASFECQTCPDGYYQAEYGKSECDACPAGKYGHSESTVCQNCPVGYYSDANASKVCYICPAGSITGTSGTGGTYCEVCPTNKNSYQSNSTECFKAPRVTFDGSEYETCSPDVTMIWQNQTDDIWEVSKENYVACNPTGGTLLAPLDLRDGSTPLPLGSVAGQIRYFISTRNCTDDGKFLTSCVAKTFGIVEAQFRGECQRQCARWKGTKNSGFQDGDIDIELRGANCNEMQASVKPLFSDMCQPSGRLLRHD